MEKTILDACNMERQGPSVLADLLLTQRGVAPRLPEVTMVELIATTIRYVWWERRQATHGESVRQPERTAQAISALVMNYTRSRKTKNNGICRHGWVKPKEDYVKLNVDDSFDADKRSGASGMILGDAHGFFIAGGNCTITFVEDAATADAMVLRDGLIMVEALGCSKLVINSDCVEVIDVMKNGSHTQGPAAAIYEDCFFFSL
jgi:hypothetical protein